MCISDIVIKCIQQEDLKEADVSSNRVLFAELSPIQFNVLRRKGTMSKRHGIRDMRVGKQAETIRRTSTAIKFHLSSRLQSSNSRRQSEFYISLLRRQ